MKKKQTTEEFIEKANKIHNNKYDYSKTEYISAKIKITIICPKHGKFSQAPYSHLKGHGCFWCSNRPRYNTETFIKKANEIHNNKYDYSKVNYTGCYKKIIIMCPFHGSFKQKASSHINGNGCSKCAKVEKLTTKTFIKKANEIHNNKYDYSKVNYVNNREKVIITCPKHGEFKQVPASHLSGSGCLKCSGIILSTTEKFIKKANEIHNNKYDYSNVNYIGNKNKVIIVCPEHGEFKQKPNCHLSGYGCIKCGGKYKLTTEKFIEKANKIHNNKYDYSKVNYINNRTKVRIICPLHGSFKQVPNNHLSGQNCPRCCRSISNMSQKWLDKLNIPVKCREKTLKIGKRRFVVDALDNDNKIVYEFYGDYWHGNPQKFAPNDINPSCKKTYRELYRNTLIREKEIKDAGYKIISIWESETI